MFHRVLTLFATVWLLATGTVRAQAILEPPYGLKWGDSPEKLISWASRHSLDVTISVPGDQPALRVVKIQARKGFLPGTSDAAVEGRFFGGRMFELTVHYIDPEASADLMETRFQQLKQKLSSELGTLVADQQQRSTADQFTTRTQAYHREPVKGLFLMLAFTEIEDLLRKTKDARYSVIYRNDNLRQELEKLMRAPAAPQDGR
ncbi:hypothetical protein [Luteolibacter sp. LG18]|uniref:hypothetical protein n=1 Tax=Luteolibacter sp. LG18 TaxID=2819286 RepID=UPI002B286B89|nr:hypothetical protein llg_37880 [Luteolibacter sp. LG18]